MAQTPSFSIVIVSLNGARVIARALDAVLATDYPDYEVIVVDNGSTDDLADIVRNSYPSVHLVQSPVNLGFAGGNNLGIREACGDIVVLLNDDTEVRPGWLKAWAEAASRCDDWGVLGCKLLYPDGETIQHAGGALEANGLTHHLGYGEPDDGRFDEELDCEYVTGAAMAVRRDVLAELGGLDETYFPIYFEEVDLCHRVRASGRRVRYVPSCVVVHHESRTQSRYSFRFHFRYTRCRLRYILRCFTARQLVRAAGRELRWWLRGHSWECYVAYPCAYLAILPRLPWLLRDRLR